MVYDAVGKDTFLESLDCLRPRGMMVSYGNASGPPPRGEPAGARQARLAVPDTALRSSTTSRQRAELDAAARELFAVVKNKTVRVRIGQTYPLAEAAEAHRDLEGRRTTGSTLPDVR